MRSTYQDNEARTPKQKLDNKLWTTRKSRINASERLQKAASFIDFTNVYYSIFLIILSLLSISPFCNDNGLTSYVGLAGSISLTISIIYATSLKYRERSAALKQNYIALQKLLDRLNLLNDENSEEIRTIQSEYTDLLSSVENHTHIDYLNLLRTGKVYNESMTFGNWCYLISYYLWNYLWKTVLIAAPIGYIVYIIVLHI